MNDLLQKQTEQINEQIRKSSEIQESNLSVSTNSINESIDKLNKNLFTSINQNTFAIAASSALLQKTFKNGFNSINNTLNLGFNSMNNEIGKMKSDFVHSFEELNRTIDRWGVEINNKLEHIENIVDNPILTKSRELYRLGYNNAIKKFYEEAVGYLEKAINLNKTDYFSYGLLGKIYLFGNSEYGNVTNFSKALNAFEKACKYIIPDTIDNKEICKIAADFYFYYGYTYYLLSFNSEFENKKIDFLSNSIKAFNKSFAFSGEMYESVFYASKALYLKGNEKGALEIIKNIVLLDKYYTIKYLNDDDLKLLEGKIIELINSLRDENYNKLQSICEYLKNNYMFFNCEFSQKASDLITKAMNIDKTIPYIDLIELYDNIKSIYKLITSNNIPYEVVAYNKSCTINESDSIQYKLCNFSKNIYGNNNIIIECTQSSKVTLGFNTPPFLYSKYSYGYKISFLSYGKAVVNVIQTDIDRYSIDKSSAYNTWELKIPQWQIDDNTIFRLSVNPGRTYKSFTYHILILQKSIIKKENLTHYEPTHVEVISRTTEPVINQAIEVARMVEDYYKKICDNPSKYYPFDGGPVYGAVREDQNSLNIDTESYSILDLIKYVNRFSNNETIKNIESNIVTLKNEATEKLKKIYYSETPSGFCYIATCVYHSYDCPQLWTLRRYRDLFLAKSCYGRLFIKVYYFISPKIVLLFGKMKWFNILFKKILDKKVIQLNNQGFDNTPYEDKKTMNSRKSV